MRDALSSKPGAVAIWLDKNKKYALSSKLGGHGKGNKSKI